MSKNLIVAAGIALILALMPNDSRAQDNPAGQQPATTPTPPVAPANPAVPGQPLAPGPVPRPGPRPMPPRMRHPRMYVQRATADLRMLKMALQNDQEDYGGHKEAALAACDKAMQELEELLKAMPMPMRPQRPGPPPGATFQQNLNRVNPPPGNPPPAAPPTAPPPAATPPPQ